MATSKRSVQAPLSAYALHRYHWSESSPDLAQKTRQLI